jgi:hypothetical protein
MKYIVFAMFFAATAATATPKDQASAKSRSTSIPQAHARVSDTLKDPDAARFKSDFVGKDKAVCGMVNGKNSYGGYGGFRRYIVHADNVWVESNDPNEAWKIDMRWAEMCSE